MVICSSDVVGEVVKHVTRDVEHVAIDWCRGEVTVAYVLKDVVVAAAVHHVGKKRLVGSGGDRGCGWPC